MFIFTTGLAQIYIILLVAGHHITPSDPNFVLVKQKLFPFKTLLFTNKENKKFDN